MTEEETKPRIPIGAGYRGIGYAIGIPIGVVIGAGIAVCMEGRHRQETATPKQKNGLKYP